MHRNNWTCCSVFYENLQDTNAAAGNKHISFLSKRQARNSSDPLYPSYILQNLMQFESVSDVAICEVIFTCILKVESWENLEISGNFKDREL